MKRFKVSAAQRKELDAHKATISQLWEAGQKKRAEARGVEAEASELVRLAEEFERTGNIRDTAAMIECEVRRRQAVLLQREADRKKAEADELDTKIPDVLADIHATVAAISRESLAHHAEELTNAFTPFYREGFGKQAALGTPFLEAFTRWFDIRQAAGIRDIHTRAQHVEMEINNLLKFGAPQHFGCAIHLLPE